MMEQVENGTERVWTEEQIIRALRDGLYLADSDVDQRRAFPASVYINMTSDEKRYEYRLILDALDVVREILSDVANGRKALSVSCREHNMPMMRFRRFCERVLQVCNGGKVQKNLVPAFEATMELNLYAKVFGISIEEADAMMPDDAEETVEYILSTLTDREAGVIRQRMRPNRIPMETIGEQYGVSRERIRQIEAHCLRKMRRPKTVELLKNGIGKMEETDSDFSQERIADEVLAIPIKDLDLSARAYHRLHFNGMKTVGDVAKMRKRDIAHWYGVGDHTMNEIVCKMREYGVELQ